jgi:hypothetical protein
MFFVEGMMRWRQNLRKPAGLAGVGRLPVQALPV